VKDIHDVIKLAKFDDDRLRGSGVVAGQISAFPIDFAGRSYNTLTLPCERVISIVIIMLCYAYGFMDDVIFAHNCQEQMPQKGHILRMT